MTVNQGVTRLEIADAVGPVFGQGGATRDEIVEAGRASARPEIVEVLQGLPDRRYGRLNELWEELQGIPVGA